MRLTITVLACFFFSHCNKDAPSEGKSESTKPITSPINFGIEDYRATVATLKPYRNAGPDGEVPDEPWTDTEGFRKWLEEFPFNEEDASALMEIVPSVTLAMNHGPLLGVEHLMDENTNANHQVKEAGFLIFSTGPNGDFMVIDILKGQEACGRAGWLPMAMIYGMDSKEVREHFIPTSKTLGGFLRASAEEWSSVPKDWYDAERKAEADD